MKVGNDEKLQKHLEDLDGSTTGGSNVAIRALSKAVDALTSIALRKGRKADEEADDEEEEEETFEKSGKNERAKISRRQGGDIEEEEEDPEDPADTGEGDTQEGSSIISNQGKRIPKSSLGEAVSKNYREMEDELFKNYGEVLDASPAVELLAKNIRSLTKSVVTLAGDRSDSASVEQLLKQNRQLAKGMLAMAEAVAGISQDLELIKKQPVNQPASGMIVGLTKKEDNKEIHLSKSDIADVINEQLQKSDPWSDQGRELSRAMAKLGSVRSQADLDKFLGSLPDDVRGLLN